MCHDRRRGARRARDKRRLMEEREVKAAIRVLGAVVRADGKIEDEEKAAFRDAVFGLDPSEAREEELERLLNEPSDLDADLAQVTTPLLQKAVFETAFAIVISDR